MGFNGVVIDLQHHFETYPNYQNLPKISTEIYDNVVDFMQLRAVESQPSNIIINVTASANKCSPPYYFHCVMLWANSDLPGVWEALERVSGGRSGGSACGGCGREGGRNFTRKKFQLRSPPASFVPRRCPHCKSVVGLQVNTRTRQLNEVEKFKSTAPGVGR